MSRTRLLALPLALFMLLTFFVAVASPAYAIADKDCGDFGSQKAAQEFYLQQGGPQQDPHGLDSENDGVACESNPCPCYYGTQQPGDNPPAPPPPPPAPVKSAVELSATPAAGITGEKMRLVAQVTPRFSRPIVLQRKAGDRWVKALAGKTSGEGRWVVTGPVFRKTTTFRVTVPATKRDGKQYTAATSAGETIKTLAQDVNLQLSDGSVIAGDRVIATATARPVRAGRPVVLQKRTSSGWTRVDSDLLNRQGEADFVLDTDAQGNFRYRAVVQRYRGAVPSTSETRELRVSPAPDTTAPAVPTGLTATAGDGSVALDWADVSASDLRGYYVYYATSASGPWSQANATPVTTSSYTASGLSNGTPYYFCVRSIDFNGNLSACSTSASATPAPPADTTAPATPQALTATSGDRAVDLDWADVTASDLAGYRVYMATAADGPWTLLTAEPVASSAYRAEGLTNGTEYFFRVTAVDTAGNESPPSEVTSATPTAATPAP
jgi:hypothetical protein